MSRKNKRKTRYIVYVDGYNMDKPSVLFDAAYAHLIRKDYPIKERKLFMAEFIKAVTDEEKVEVVNGWVQVRDIATFPMQHKNRGLKHTPGDVEQLDELIIPERKEVPADNNKMRIISAGKDDVEQIQGMVESGKLAIIDDVEEECSEDKEAEGGVPVDDGADEEPESGAAPE